MTTEQVVAFLLFAVVAAVTPGRSNTMLTAVGAHAGILRGLPSLFGVMTGMGLMMFLVRLGLRDDSTAYCSSYRNDFCLRSNGRIKEERWTQRECPRSFRA